MLVITRPVERRIIIRDSKVRIFEVARDRVRVLLAERQGPAGRVGIFWRGTWDDAVNYVLNDGVTFSGSSWRALRANVNVSPVEGADWTIIAKRGLSGSETQEDDVLFWMGL